MNGSLLLCLSAPLALVSNLDAALIVSSPETVTHIVQVQPIIVEPSGGSEQAEFMGNAASETYIKEQVDRAWAQVGVDIEWLTPVSYENDFAYDGSPGNYSRTERPQEHLDDIVDNAGFPPKNGNGVVLNMFFVEIVPGFNHLDDYYANGLAYVDSNGIAMHVGRELVTWTEGRDVVASVIAHEIGHNLGLSHYNSSNTNLMYGGSGPEDRLVGSQKTTIFEDKSWRLDSFDYLQAIIEETNYEIWAATYGVSTNPEDDDDGDRLSNGFEFLYGSAPDVPNAFPSPTQTPAGLVWSLPKNADAVEDGFDYNVQTSPGLTGWQSAGSAGSGSTVLTDSASQISVRLDSGAASAFLRVEVAPPPAAGAAAIIPPDEGKHERVYSDCKHAGCGLHQLRPPTDD